MLPNKHKKKIIGRRELVNFPLLDIHQIEAKIDTGAYTCSIHCENILLKTVQGKHILTFQLTDERVYSFENFHQKKSFSFIHSNLYNCLHFS